MTRNTVGNTLLLTKIYLHCWHSFVDQVIPIRGNTYVGGVNGSGKSTILDAIQLVLIAHREQIRFNSSAHDGRTRSERTIESYVRYQISTTRFLRPNDTIAYVVLEFANTAQTEHALVGVCLEARARKEVERFHFILSEPFERSLFFNEHGRARTRGELEQAFLGRPNAVLYDRIESYQKALVNRLGGFGPAFFDMFVRGLTFEPIGNLGEFIEQWVVPQKKVDVATLLEVHQKWVDLQALTEEATIKHEELTGIVNQQGEVRRLTRERDIQTLLEMMLRHEEAQRAYGSVHQQLDDVTQQIAIDEGQRAEREAKKKLDEGRLKEARDEQTSLGVERRYETLQKAMQDARAVLRSIEESWGRLCLDLIEEGETLEAAAHHPALQERERDVVRTLSRLLKAVPPSAPPPDTLAARLATSIAPVKSARERLAKSVWEREQAINGIHARIKQLEQEAAHLRERKVLSSGPIESVRERMAQRLGQRPPLLYELLEVEDEVWQGAVEAVLDARRFTMIVPPGQFAPASEVVNDARREGLSGVSVLDIDGCYHSRQPAQDNSLALHVRVTTQDEGLSESVRAYIDTMLGHTITCTDVRDLQKYRSAMTPELVMYDQWIFQTLDPEKYPWTIGERAVRVQLMRLEAELKERQVQRSEQQQQHKLLEQLASVLDREGTLTALHQRLQSERLDPRPVQEQLARDEREVNSLDLGRSRELKAMIEQFERDIEDHDRAIKRLQKQLEDAHDRRGNLQSDHTAAASQLQETQKAVEERRARSAHLVESVERRFSQLKRKTKQDLRHALEVVERQRDEAEQFLLQAKNALIHLESAYNRGYGQSDPDVIGNEDEHRYREEKRRLEELNLPRYKQEISELERKAREHIRQHVIHQLREYIWEAERRFDDLNALLGKTEFHGKYYRFRSTPAEDTYPYYKLIMDTGAAGNGTPIDEQFYETRQDVVEQFFRILGNIYDPTVLDAQRDSLLDYRRYLNYEFMIVDREGHEEKFSKEIRLKSGGEVQTPIYVIMAVSFVELYRASERSGNPSIRLVVFDEAFSKMDQSFIASTLEVFDRFGLQLLVATPPERYPYLKQHMQTHLVVLKIGNDVRITSMQSTDK